MSKAKADMSFADYEKGKKAKASGKKGKVHRMHVERLDNGIMTTAHHEMAGGKHEMYAPSPETKVFHKSPEEMGSAHSVMMGGRPLIPGTPAAKSESEAAGAGDPNKAE